jgi:hypothetical protein
MKTPREAFKENFWIGAKGGLLDLKHYLKMRESIWFFLYLLHNQTSLNQAGEGVVNYGHPLTLEDVSTEFKGISTRTIRRWLTRLKTEGYIRTEPHSKQGLTFWIAKGKAKTRKVKVTTDGANEMQAHSRPDMAASPETSRPQMAASDDDSRPITAAKRAEIIGQFLSDVGIATDSKTRIPKGSISESPSYYNKAAAAKTAAVSVSSLMKQIRRKTTPPKAPSQASLDERRRELLLQAERIKRDYPAKGNDLGKVVEMKPQEATA